MQMIKVTALLIQWLKFGARQLTIGWFSQH
jgi:hypothetical protein